MLKQFARRTLRWIHGHMLQVVCVIAVTVLFFPRPAQSQLFSPCCAILATGLGTINSTMNSVIGGGLSSIQKIEQDISAFEQTIVWPLAAIQNARNLIASLIATYLNLKNLFNIRIASATLPQTQQLEQILLSRSSTNINAVPPNYTAVYGAVPPVGQAPDALRNVIDVNDAVAQEGFKRSIAADETADLAWVAADQIEQEIANQAPGTVGMVESEAQVWQVRVAAQTQLTLSQLLRVTSARVANSSNKLKMSTGDANQIGQDTLQSLP
jgi:hypothetical protein